MSRNLKNKQQMELAFMELEAIETVEQFKDTFLEIKNKLGNNKNNIVHWQDIKIEWRNYTLLHAALEQKRMDVIKNFLFSDENRIKLDFRIALLEHEFDFCFIGQNKIELRSPLSLILNAIMQVQETNHNYDELLSIADSLIQMANKAVGGSIFFKEAWQSESIKKITQKTLEVALSENREKLFRLIMRTKPESYTLTQFRFENGDSVLHKISYMRDDPNIIMTDFLSKEDILKNDIIKNAVFFEIIKLFQKENINPETLKNRDGNTPFHMAAMKEDDFLFSILVRAALKKNRYFDINSILNFKEEFPLDLIPHGIDHRVHCCDVFFIEVKGVRLKIIRDEILLPLVDDIKALLKKTNTQNSKLEEVDYAKFVPSSDDVNFKTSDDVDGWWNDKVVLPRADGSNNDDLEEDADELEPMDSKCSDMNDKELDEVDKIINELNGIITELEIYKSELERKVVSQSLQCVDPKFSMFGSTKKNDSKECARNDLDNSRPEAVQIFTF